MRMLLIAPFFPPHRGVASLRPYSFAKAWSAAGHDVCVLTTCKRADQVGLDLPLTGFRLVELSHNVPATVERLRAGEQVAVRPDLPSSRPTWKRLAFRPLRWLKARSGVFSGVRQPDTADFWVRLATRWALDNGPWDIVVGTFGPPAAVLVGRNIKTRGACRVFAADFRDLWTDHHLYGGLFPVTMWERRQQGRVLAAADRLVTVSPGLARRLQARSGKPVEIVYNGYDADGFAGLHPGPAFPADQRVRLVYTGNIYERGQDPRALCAAVAAEDQATIVVASDQADLWASLARRYSLGSRLDFRGSLPRPEALRLQRDASALILLDWRDPRQGVLTGKVFEYLVSPAPIWVLGGASESPAAALVRAAGRGVALGNDVERIRAAIRSAPGSPGPAVNRDFIAALSRQEQALRFLRLLDADFKRLAAPGR